MTDASQLLHANLHEVFGERDAEARWAAIERTYTEGVAFIDPYGEFDGWRELNDQAQRLLDGAPADSGFEEASPEYVGPDMAALAWRFGPPGRPVARGLDVLTIRDGRVSRVRTLLVSEADA